MGAYILRRLVYTIPVWLGVYAITFALFHLRDPIAIARVHNPQAPLGALQNWVRNNNMHLPRFINLPADAKEKMADGREHPEFAERTIFYSQFFMGLKDMATFNFGVDKNRMPILDSIVSRAPYSLGVMAPAFFLTVFFSISMALFVAYFRETTFDITTVLITVGMMSIPVPVYLLASNLVFGKFSETCTGLQSRCPAHPCGLPCRAWRPDSILPHGVPRADGTGLHSHRTRERSERRSNSVQTCAAQFAYPDFDKRGHVSAILDYRLAGT
jgi:ABC-type dipeptide/oligopeptide/nickel transport system permease component